MHSCVAERTVVDISGLKKMQKKEKQKETLLCIGRYILFQVGSNCVLIDSNEI